MSAKNILDTILSIQPKDSSGGVGETREATVYRLADDMLSKLPKDYIPFEVRRLHDDYKCIPLNIDQICQFDDVQCFSNLLLRTQNNPRIIYYYTTGHCIWCVACELN